MKQGWNYKKLGELITLKSGYTPKSSELSSSGEVPYFKVAEMNYSKNNKHLVETYQFVTNPKSTFPQGSIVFPKNGAAIATNKKRILAKPSVVDLNTAVAIPTGTIDVDFLYYIFQRIDFRNITRGGAVPTLDTAALKNTIIPVPSIEEQTAICSLLDKMNRVIEAKKEQLKELDNLAQAIFYDMFGDPLSNEKGWEIRKYGKEFKIGAGGTPSKSVSEYWENGTIPWIGSNMCQNRIIYQTDGKYITQEGLSHSSAKMLEKGTVIVALVGATIGKVGLLETETSTNQNVAYINVNENPSFNSYFVYYQLQKLYELFMAIGNGDFKMANQGFIKDLPIITPPLPLQQALAEKVKAIERQKELINQSIKDVQTLFDAKMDYYFGD